MAELLIIKVRPGLFSTLHPGKGFIQVFPQRRISVEGTVRLSFGRLEFHARRQVQVVVLQVTPHLSTRSPCRRGTDSGIASMAHRFNSRSFCSEINKKLPSFPVQPLVDDLTLVANIQIYSHQSTSLSRLIRTPKSIEHHFSISFSSAKKDEGFS